MDRAKLHRWLDSPHRTWRWAASELGGYEGVATQDQGLYWFRWSHDFDTNGEHDAELQSWDNYEQHGPLRTAPPDTVKEIRRWVEEHR